MVMKLSLFHVSSICSTPTSLIILVPMLFLQVVATISFLASGCILSLGGLSGHKALLTIIYQLLYLSGKYFSLGRLGNHKTLTFFLTSYLCFYFLQSWSIIHFFCESFLRAKTWKLPTYNNLVQMVASFQRWKECLCKISSLLLYFQC